MQILSSHLAFGALRMRAVVPPLISPAAVVRVIDSFSICPELYCLSLNFGRPRLIDCSYLLTCLVETSSPLQNKLGEMSVGEMRVCEVWCWQNEGVDEKGRMWVLVKCGRN